MADLLIRNIDPSIKRALAIRAAEHGRSQQAEALAILNNALQDQENSWADFLMRTADEVGGMEFEVPQRHAPRFTAVEF